MSLEKLVEEFIRYWTTDRAPDGCGMCGGLPHSTTCFVGRFDMLLRAGTVQPQEHAKATSVGAASQIDLSTTEAAAFKAGWQPIETAPKDGSRILIYGKFQNLDEHTRGHAYWYADSVWITHPIDYPYNDRIVPEWWAPLDSIPVESKAGSVK